MGGAPVRADATDRPASGPAAAHREVGEGYGTEAVVAFYEALLQDKPPTVEQERAIFDRTSGVRTRLVLGDRAAIDDEPMTRTPERRRQREQDDQKVEAAGPVVLEYLRAHRDWFLPVNGIGSGRDIQVSSFMRFVRNLEGPKPPATWGYVVTLFPDERGARPARLRSVVFGIRDDGKVNPDNIALDGFGGETVFDRVFAGEAKDGKKKGNGDAIR